MSHVNVPKGLFYYVGEKPPALTLYYRDESGALITTIAGATLTAKCQLGDSGTEFDVGCTNTGDGSFTIDWPAGTSSFVATGALRVDIQVEQGAYVWYMPRFAIEIRER